MLRVSKTIEVCFYDLGIQYVTKWVVDGKPVHSFYPFNSDECMRASDRLAHDLRVLNGEAHILFKPEDFEDVKY